ncbi:hypothetical protein [Sphingopyxis sp. 113P3]|uniref:hypothetical protein n=1 Tax=Sphingopyxis sp. (strain 113P3) TaxID=292913 RepID=UPI0006AD5C06|nr:hypothetical protein [Sphingopyxis sp. 113P3]ALC11949.1 UDP-4-amino-4-deoxy-L-arabinose formyltransferase / UDP-glucuronic acid dehydrogenase (UDP-4-keto-hexauronic acid decarboxylating) [Sphingopyxis sp. 113P3]
MRTLLLASLLVSAPAAAQEAPLIGEYRLSEGPDAAGGLLIGADGRFQYGLAVGALDERAEGRWEPRGDQVCLFTEPKPVPPAFEKGPLIEVEGKVPTLLVTGPDDDGVPGIDFVIGFDSGAPAKGYTQYYGWSMPEEDKRIPRWVEVGEPMYGLALRRFDLTESDGGRLRIAIIPNDMGIVDFNGACVEKTQDGVILHRAEGDMRFAPLRELE